MRFLEASIEYDFPSGDLPECNTDFSSLQAAAEHGDTSAMVCLGKRLLAGRNAPFEPEEGVALIRRASDLGNPDALCMAATLYGAGAWLPHSWSAALDHLVLAAQRGSFDACEQLTILAWKQSYDGKPVPQGYWQQLRDGIDLETLVQPPAPEQISDSPRVWRISKCVSLATCRRLIRSAKGKLKPAKVYDRRSKALANIAGRNNSDFVFDIAESSVILLLVRIRISLLLSLPVPNMEPPQILHYKPGEEFRPHFDFVTGERETGQGDRAATFLLALNDDYEGGETEFLHSRLQWRGAAGDALFFANLRDGKPDRQSLHAGRPVTGGEKWLLSQWVRNAPFAG